MLAVFIFPVVCVSSVKERSQSLLNVFWEKQLVKATICLGRGKKLHDKRQSLKDKQVNRESDRAMKGDY